MSAPQAGEDQDVTKNVKREHMDPVVHRNVNV